ncbi:MAG TPA: helix-turn-helix domain-containing protein [Candidatus Enterenecus stercoripullorum]|nr:helix-turn-helix domain-containing protein [Candidatus Enterenecus stercoripullorum]
MSIKRYDLALRDAHAYVPRAKLLYITTAKYDGDWQSVLHTHACTEIFCVVGGKGQFQIRSQVFPVSQGDLVVVNPNVEHTETSLPSYPMAYIVVGVEGLELSMDGELDGCFRMTNVCEYAADVPAYLQSMLREVEGQAPGFETVCQNLLGILLIQLTRGTGLAANTPTPQANASRGATAARDFIHLHFRENLTLEQLAEAVHTSKYHLVHTFRRQFGTSPLKYVQSLRLQESRKLLSTTDFSLTYIARMTGFSSPSYFSQRFLSAEGVTPTQYRKIHRQSAQEEAPGPEETAG